MNIFQKASGWLSDLVGGAASSFLTFGLPTYSGKTVTPENSIQVPAIWCAMKILAETIGSLPFAVYQRTGDDSNSTVAAAKSHDLYTLLHDSPNPEMSAIDFRMAQTAQLSLWGNCYSRIARNASGDVIALWPMQSKLMQIKRDNNGDLYYEYTSNGRPEPYQATDILHVRTLSMDGVHGISPIAQLPNPVGLAMALEEYAARFFGNGAIPGIALEHPQKLSPNANRNIRDSWKALYSGNQHAHEVAILEEGMKVQVLGKDPAQSQSVESRKFQIAEVARIYRIPLHMLAEMERSTNNNIEHQSLEFVIYTLMPWLEMWEQAVNRSLLSPTERRRGYFVEHNVGGLLRGDIQSRYAAYAVGRQWGWFSVNDILRLENMNGIGPKGDIRLQPMNMIPAGTPIDKYLRGGGAGSNGVGKNPGAPSSGAGNGPTENPQKSETELRAAIMALAAMMRH